MELDSGLHYDTIMIHDTLILRYATRQSVLYITMSPREKKKKSLKDMKQELCIYILHCGVSFMEWNKTWLTEGKKTFDL